MLKTATFNTRLLLGLVVLCGAVTVNANLVNDSTGACGRPAYPRFRNIQLKDPTVRRLWFDSLAGNALVRKQDALEHAAKNHWKTSGAVGNIDFELVGVTNGRPIYYTTVNVDAGDATGAKALQDNFGLDANSVTVGVWDSGAVLDTHVEFQQDNNSRVTIRDGGWLSNHATHVAGTIGASGNDPDAKGMAPAVLIDSYNWSFDSVEMFGRAATAPGELDKIQMSNHSYGTIAGWEHWGFFYDPNFISIPGDFDEDGIVNIFDLAVFAQYWLSGEPGVDIAPEPVSDEFVDFVDYAVFANNWGEVRPPVLPLPDLVWFGVWGEREDWAFGAYVWNAPEWDWVCYEAPYYLPFKAAGNDRNDRAPAPGTSFFYYAEPNETNPDASDAGWLIRVYDPGDPNAPYDDGWDGGFGEGYDTILPGGTAKNVMTVGAIDKHNGMTTFTGWGPTDDGRIKPDIVATGTDLFSSTAGGDNATTPAR